MKIKLPRLKLNNTDALSLQVYAYLRTLIIQNQLPPGTALSENELSAHFDISRQPVRESLARLSREELVEIIPQKGSFVKKISVKNLKEVCFVRVAMECSAVRDAMELDEKSFNRILTRLEKNLAQQKALGPERKNAHERFLYLDDTFHALLCSFSGTDLAWNLVQSIKGNLDRIRFFTFEHISRVEHLCAEHSEILNCIKERDEEKACCLLKAHLYTISETYKQAMEEQTSWFLDEDVAAWKKARRKSA
ncbi:MAG TPA: GntR family transcriptional regulator [Candidatus Avisuccinivibrio pullicola]|nr:GntR family transcriptional regulator [Candidatus Avisuccinivibrio pullicola]